MRMIISRWMRDGWISKTDRHHWSKRQELSGDSPLTGTCVLNLETAVLIHREVDGIHMLVMLAHGCIETVEVNDDGRIALIVAQALPQESQFRFFVLTHKYEFPF